MSSAGDQRLLPTVSRVALAAARCTTGSAVLVDGRWKARGDPLDAALDVLARRLRIDLRKHEIANPLVRRHPFGQRRRRMSIQTNGELYVKGAPETVLPLCRGWSLADDGELGVKVSQSFAGDAIAALDALAARGLRVIAVAKCRLTAVEMAAALGHWLVVQPIHRGRSLR